jgi:hypothetical protein
MLDPPAAMPALLVDLPVKAGSCSIDQDALATRIANWSALRPDPVRHPRVAPVDPPILYGGPGSTGGRLHAHADALRSGMTTSPGGPHPRKSVLSSGLRLLPG